MDQLNTIQGEVAAVRVLKNGIVQIKVRKNGRLLGRDVVLDKTPDKSNEVTASEIDYKLLKVHQSAPTMVKATYDYSALIGSKYNRFVSSEKFGNFIAGPTTFTAHPESIRMGGVFRFNGLLTSTMPSTIITPVPTLVFDMPAQDTLNEIKSILTNYKSELSQLI